ncbi:MAG: TonB-dependent receptor plug domain-containing protein [Caulobacteraceae bacterium]
MKMTLMAGAAALCSLTAAQVHAQAPAAVSEVQVTARTLETTLPEKLAETGVKVDIVPSQAIRNGGYVDVATSLQALAPSLFVLPKNGPFDYVDLSLMGSRTGDVLFMVDGVRINNRLYAGTTPLDTMPAGMVDRLEILDSGQALFYGTQAVAGAVNIVTKPFSKTLTGMISGQVDTNTARHLEANVADGFKFGDVVLYASADQSDGYKSFRDQDYQPSSTHRKRSYDSYTEGLKYGLDLSEQLRLSASYQRTDGALDFAAPYRVARDVNNRHEDLATGKLDYQVSDRLGFFVKGYWHNWRTTYDQFYNDLAKPGTLDKLYEGAFWGFKDYGVNALGEFDVAKGVEAYFGYDYQAYGGRDEVLVIDQHDETTHAVFGQLRLSPEMIPGLNLAGGFRYNAPSFGQSATVWNVSGRYQAPQGFYVKGEAGTNFRLPTAEELFANDPLDERGNPNLKPERSIGGDLTVGWRFDMGGHRVGLEATGFARDVIDLIDLDTFDSVTQQDVFGNVAGTVRVRGGQVSADAAVTDAFSGNLAYSVNEAKQDGGKQLDRIPKSLFKAGLDWHPADRPFGATLNVVYTGDVTRSVGAFGSQNYGNYTVVDLSGRWFLDSGRRQQLNLSIRNLFDQRYGLPSRGCKDTPADGPYDCSIPYVYVNLGMPRTFAVSYTYKF